MVKGELAFPVMPNKANDIWISFLHHPGRGDLTHFAHCILKVCVAIYLPNHTQAHTIIDNAPVFISGNSTPKSTPCRGKNTNES